MNNNGWRVGLLALAVMLVGQPLPVMARAGKTVGANEQAAINLSPDPAEFAKIALLIVNAVTHGGAPQVWDASSPVMKTIVSRDLFVQSMQQRTASAGELKNLTWRSIIRVQMAQPQGQLPAGSYLSVAVSGVGSNNQQVVQTVSFHLDDDQRWRLIGISAS